jgi:hypothetical protein
MPQVGELGNKSYMPHTHAAPYLPSIQSIRTAQRCRITCRITWHLRIHYPVCFALQVFLPPVSDGKKTLIGTYGPGNKTYTLVKRDTRYHSGNLRRHASCSSTCRQLADSVTIFNGHHHLHWAACSRVNKDLADSALSPLSTITHSNILQHP